MYSECVWKYVCLHVCIQLQQRALVNRNVQGGTQLQWVNWNMVDPVVSKSLPIVDITSAAWKTGVKDNLARTKPDNPDPLFIPQYKPLPPVGVGLKAEPRPDRVCKGKKPLIEEEDEIVELCEVHISFFFAHAENMSNHRYCEFCGEFNDFDDTIGGAKEEEEEKGQKTER